jgi:hypothetical protein
MIRLLFLGLALVCAGCRTEHSDFFPYHEDGTPKPNVALVPMIVECKTDVPWNLSQELTSDIRKTLMRHGLLFLPREVDLQKQLGPLSQKELVSNKDLMPFLHFQPEHFVVVLELIEHKEVPYKRGQIKPLYVANIPANDAVVLMMKVRLRIIDIRGGEPKLIRQEIVESNHMMPKGALQQSIAQHGTEAFGISPLGLAHARLVRDVTAIIERITSYKK